MLAVTEGAGTPAATDHSMEATMSNPANTPNLPKRTCSVDGCDRPHDARGWCKIHYNRWKRHGDPIAGNQLQRPPGLSTAEIIDYELRRAERRGDCLITPLPKSHGYGVSWFGDRLRKIHRIVLQASIGRELARHEYACHRCHTPACINPDHLYVGVQAINMRDSSKAGRMATGERNPNTKLTDSQVREIRQRYAAGNVTMATLAVEYAVSRPYIGDLIDGSARSNVKS